jgi:hypothetical protein
MVLVLDDEATRVISSVLTMYDIMEERVTLVEQLAKNRQPFREMEVIYLVSPTVDAATKIVQDFPSEGKAKYGGVHIYFLDVVRKLTSALRDLTSSSHRSVMMSSGPFKDAAYYVKKLKLSKN